MSKTTKTATRLIWEAREILGSAYARTTDREVKNLISEALAATELAVIRQTDIDIPRVNRNTRPGEALVLV